jgi:Na+-driven multidrug efflux pump
MELISTDGPTGVASQTRLGRSSQPQPSRRLLEGTVLPTLLGLAAPTVALMMLQGLISAGEAAFVGRLGASSLAGVSLSFPLVMLMTTLSAGAYGGGVASAVARAIGAGRFDDANRLAGTALTLSAFLGAAFTVVMVLGGQAFYQTLGATGPALDAAVQYSNLLFLGAAPFWTFNAAASIRRAGGNAMFPATAGAIGGIVTLAISPLLIFGIGAVRGFGIAGVAGAVVAYNCVMAIVLLRADDHLPARRSSPCFRAGHTLPKL